MPSHMPTAIGRVPHGETVHCWPGTDELRVNKERIVKVLRDQGADDKRIALVLASVMAETTTISARDRDASKDGQGPAKNYSAYNMNGYALARLGWVEGQGVDLNQDCNLEQATLYFNRGLDGFGETQWLYLHRGGETALRDGYSYGCREYAGTVRAIAQYLLADTSRFSDANRYGTFIEHV